MDLSYDWGFDNTLKNGNISGSKWRSKGDGQQRAYGFSYDDANRFLFADFNQYTSGGWGRTAGIDFSVVMGDGQTPGMAYDPNGNILSMDQKGLLGPGAGSSQPIDQLRYTYNTNSNRLQNVFDSANNAATTLGDFRTDSLSPYFASKPTTAVDYYYDANGNLTRDLNKDIGSSTADGIVYNHLNLPWQITFRSKTGNKGSITYIYDAIGNKLKKTTNDTAANLQTVTTYIGAFQYQSRQALGSGIPADTLQFFGQGEGRVRLKTDTAGGQAVSSWKYDYFLKDHLGNTRMVLTDEQETDQYPAATMEVGDSSLENLYYTNLDETRVALPPGYPTDTTTKPNTQVAELYSADGNPVIGPGIVLKVMAGDQFSIKTSSWYQNSGTRPGQVPNPVSDLVSALIAGVSHIPGEGATAGALSGSPTLTPNMLNFLADTGMVTIDQTKPHAFLNWILFDNQFNYVAASSGYQQVGASGTLDQMVQTNLPISTSGFLYIYVSNTTPNVAVFFDNLQVTHVRGPLLEENHYYPFGLTMAGISNKAEKWGYAENKYRFNKGSELQNKEFADGSGLEMYETHLRELDPQVGRWWQVDPTPDESASLYSSMGNNPILRNDPLGDVDGDYYNEKGEHIGNDGKDDNKVYVVRTTKTTTDLYGNDRDDQPGNSRPITKEAAEQTEKKIKNGDFDASVTKNVVQIQPEKNMEKMEQVVSRDDGTGGTKPQNNREYSGRIENGQIKENAPGAVGDPSKGKPAKSIGTRVDFHSHPSGTKRLTLPGGVGATAYWGYPTQAPSRQDISTAGGTEYVFGMRDNTIYIYNKSGVLATIPLNTFKK